jgi:sugar/nucleoside kinase (ribokinase family)
MTANVYVYGMTVLSTIHRLTGPLEPDGYAEISESYVCPGGEAMNAAMLLSRLGLKVSLGGPHFGRETQATLTRYAERYAIDISGILVDEGFPGVRDLVLVDSNHRAVLGWFERYFSEKPARFGEPDPKAIRAADVIAIDPYFGESSIRAAATAREANKPYVTIDCPHDGELARDAAVTVISREFRRQQYPGQSDEDLFASYTRTANGLTIFTSGPETICFGRRDSPVQSFTPFRVAVKSTLGAGDTFRAGIVYGIARGFDEPACVRFASGLAALLCTKLPIADNAPTLEEVQAFLASRGS